MLSLLFLVLEGPLLLLAAFLLFRSASYCLHCRHHCVRCCSIGTRSLCKALASKSTSTPSADKSRNTEECPRTNYDKCCFVNCWVPVKDLLHFWPRFFLTSSLEWAVELLISEVLMLVYLYVFFASPLASHCKSGQSSCTEQIPEQRTLQRGQSTTA